MAGLTSDTVCGRVADALSLTNPKITRRRRGVMEERLSGSRELLGDTHESLAPAPLNEGTPEVKTAAGVTTLISTSPVAVSTEQGRHQR